MFDPVCLKVLEGEELVASIFVDGSTGGQEDYYAVVSIDGFLEDQKVYGNDAVQAISLAIQLVEKLTQDARVSETSHSSAWKLVVS